MQSRSLAMVAAVWFCACDPKIPIEPADEVVTARFDPSAAVPVVPTPNDLATNPATGRLAVTAPAGATGADKNFYAYLNSLNGFPSSAGATATFTGTLDAASVVKPESVKVYDITMGNMPVAATVTYVEADEGESKSKIVIAGPTGGWVPGHSYAVGLVGGSAGLKGSAAAGARPVVGSATWTFLRTSKPLVTCADLTSPDCKPATEIIPSPIKDNPAKRYADQTRKAITLERLRLKYKPTVDKLIADGAKREDIVLAWHFKIADFMSVVFDPAATPPKVPLPNDLAIDRTTGLLKVPDTDPSYSPAYVEFIRDYLNTLDGFPVSAAASVGVTGGDLDPASVNNDSVLVLDLDGDPLGVPNVKYTSATHTIDIAPPGGSWGKGRQLAVVVFGRRDADVGDPDAEAAVEQVGGGAVVASSVWAIVRSPSALVSCPNNDLTSPDCKLSFTAAPLTLGQAISLEQLRRIYAPALAAVEAAGRSRDEVAILWTFRTVSLPEATFDPSASIIPFPNNVLRGGMPAHLTLPIPDGGSALQQNLVAGLNTLDGFSLTAPIVSESSETRGALDIGQLDPDSLDAGMGFLRLGAGIAPRVDYCLNCRSSLLPDGGAPNSPQQLQIVPRLPLDEQATYGAYLTTDLKDVDGHRVIAAPAFALTRLLNPLCDMATMKSTVPVLADVQACGAGGQPGLEQLRAGLKPFVDNLVTAGLTRKKLALAWAFTTESTVSELTTLAGAVAAVPSLVTTVTAAPIATSAGVPQPISAVFGALPSSHISAVYLGSLTLPFGLTGPGNTIRPPNNWTAQKTAYTLTVPTGGTAATVWPVVIFGHGLTSNRNTMVAIADSLAAAGFATIAVDVVWHGERTTCRGSGPTLVAAGVTGATDDFACAGPTNNTAATPDPANAMCSATTGRCVARPGGNITPSACASDVQCLTQNQGFCIAGTCEGADFWRNASRQPRVNAWNFLNLGNLFATRDNFRHYAIDLAQLVRIIKADAFFAAGGPHLDMTNINYVGQSLGGFNGTLFAATNQDVKYVMLNVPGSDQVGALLASPGFKPVRDGFLAQLAPLGLTPGTPQFDQLTTLLRTIMDKSDPQNFGYTAVNSALPTTRKVFIQSIANDFVVPNFTTDLLINAANSGAKMAATERVNPTLIAEPPAGTPCMPAPGQLCPSSRHGFLLNFVDPATTAAAQTKAATFMATGVP